MSLDLLESRRRAHATGRGRQTRAELRPLQECAGRTLAEPLTALIDLPPFDRSAMDGWVVSGDGPWRLLEPLAAGAAPPREELPPGSARAITTGAPVPAGPVAVLRREHGTDSTGVLLPTSSGTFLGPGADIRGRGEEARGGEQLLDEGTILTPAGVALAAVAGHDRLLVRQAPSVDLLILGDEIVRTGTPTAGRVRDAYGPALPALLEQLGARPGTARYVEDRLSSTVDAIDSSRGDVLLTTGGTALGTGDHVRTALNRLGGTLVLDGVAMRPGSPALLALLSDGRPLLALPGNPFAALVALLTLGAPLLEGVLGRALGRTPPLPAAERLENPRRTVAVVACCLTDDGMRPCGWQGAGMLRGLASADFLALVPPGGAGQGDAVPTIPLPR